MLAVVMLAVVTLAVVTLAVVTLAVVMLPVVTLAVVTLAVVTLAGGVVVLRCGREVSMSGATEAHVASRERWGTGTG